MIRGGMWGVQGNRAFLLNPQLAYLGTGAVRFREDWLCEFESPGDEEEEPQHPMARYNRRTHEFRFEQPPGKDSE